MPTSPEDADDMKKSDLVKRWMMEYKQCIKATWSDHRLNRPVIHRTQEITKTLHYATLCHETNYLKSATSPPEYEIKLTVKISPKFPYKRLPDDENR
jgi:hypothetical protein